MDLVSGVASVLNWLLFYLVRRRGLLSEIIVIKFLDFKVKVDFYRCSSVLCKDLMVFYVSVSLSITNKNSDGLLNNLIWILYFIKLHLPSNLYIYTIPPLLTAPRLPYPNKKALFLAFLNRKLCQSIQYIGPWVFFEKFQKRSWIIKHWKYNRIFLYLSLFLVIIDRIGG